MRSIRSKGVRNRLVGAYLQQIHRGSAHLCASEAHPQRSSVALMGQNRTAAPSDSCTGAAQHGRQVTASSSGVAGKAQKGARIRAQPTRPELRRRSAPRRRVSPGLCRHGRSRDSPCGFAQGSGNRRDCDGTGLPSRSWYRCGFKDRGPSRRRRGGEHQPVIMLRQRIDGCQRAGLSSPSAFGSIAQDSTPSRILLWNGM